MISVVGTFFKATVIGNEIYLKYSTCMVDHSQPLVMVAGQLITVCDIIFIGQTGIP